MTVKQLADALGADILTGSEDALNADSSGGYCGDLLSWVMGRAVPDGAWITIMSNANVAAVAHLAGVSCVILAENVSPDPALSARAEAEDIVLLRSPDSAFDIAGKIHALGV